MELPGLAGRGKTPDRSKAERLALELALQPAAVTLDLARDIADAHADICQLCFGVAPSREELCQVCADPERDDSSLCVVAAPGDAYAIESGHAHSGRYHVLDGLLDPGGSNTPEDIRLPELKTRVAESEGVCAEVIVATDDNPAGNHTAGWIARELATLPQPPLVSRPARGMPAGAGPDQLDEDTLAAAVHRRAPAEYKNAGRPPKIPPAQQTPVNGLYASQEACHGTGRIRNRAAGRTALALPHRAGRGTPRRRTASNRSERRHRGTKLTMGHRQPATPVHNHSPARRGSQKGTRRRSQQQKIKTPSLKRQRATKPAPQQNGKTINGQQRLPPNRKTGQRKATTTRRKS